MFSMIKRSLMPEKNSAAGSWRTWKWYVSNYAFILPFMILFAVFILRPILASLQMSFFRWEIFGPKPFIGFDNYDELLNDDLWWVALRNTVYFAFLTSALLTTLPIFIAIALNIPFRGRNVFRTLFFFPYVLSASVVGLVMRWLLGQQFGIVNHLLGSVGVGPIPFIADSDLVIPSLSVITLWWAFGFPMLIYLAGLSNIPQDIYEAARIDGARGWQMTRYITIPLLRPIILFVAVTQLISHFQVFAQPYVITNGGPGQDSVTVIFYMFRAAWTYFRMGFATTMAVFLAIIIMAFTLLQFRFGASRLEY